MTAIDVDFDPSDNRLLVRCPYYANDLIKDLPSYRWSKTKRAWLVPLIRKNVEALRSDKLRPYVSMTKAANEAILTLDRAVAVSKDRTTFPAWYPFKTEPRKHQRRALDKGYSLRAFAMFMDMQTGKSKTAIDLCAVHRMEGKIGAILILVKRSLRRNWLRQFNLHCPLPYDFYTPDSGKEREFMRWLETPHDLKVMTVGWESLSAGRMREFCKRYMQVMTKPAVIGDETTYIAGHQAIRSKEAVELGAMAEYKYALTGTPILEGPLNLFMQFEYLDPNVIGIGDFYAFRNRYAVMGGFKDPKSGRPMQVIGYQNLEELTETVAPYIFQVLKTEAYDLPPKRYEERTVELTKVQRTLYDKIKNDGAFMPKGAKEEVVLKNVLGVALRLHQVAGGYAVKPRIVKKFTVDGECIEKTVWDPVEIVAPKDNPKVIELMATMEEMGKKQGLIWCVYMPEIGAMRWALKHMGKSWGELHGGIVEVARQPVVDAFERGDTQYVLGNASTGGMGFTMMASQVNMFYSNTFKMIDRVQAEDRAYGDGQTKSGVWIDYTAEKTIDRTILAALAEKKDVAAYIRERIQYASNMLDGQA
jgi:hypothetical protein